MKAYTSEAPPMGLTPPEQHFDTLCEEEQKMKCYRLKPLQEQPEQQQAA